MKIAIYCHSIAPSIDGVCRRFTGILWELVKQKHEVILFTLEDHPQDIPNNVTIVHLDHMFFPSYPNKKVAKPNVRSVIRIWNAIAKYRPDVIHITADGLSQFFVFPGLLMGIPVVGSFHTDIIDLLTTHNATLFQKLCILYKERVDSLVLDSCATTSNSFSVSTMNILHVYYPFDISISIICHILTISSFYSKFSIILHHRKS